MPNTGANPTWGQVKVQLRGLAADELLALIHDLYEASPDNQRFLHIRVLGAQTEIQRYRRLVSEAVFPNPLGRRPVRIGEAQRLIRQYQRANADVGTTVDLILTFVEAGTEQAADLGYGNEQYFAALEGSLRSAVKLARKLPVDVQAPVVSRLQRLVKRAAHVGWGFGDIVAEVTAPMLRAAAESGLRRARSNKALQPAALLSR